MKTITQRNLSLLTTYTITGSFYAGMEDGTCCENCGKLIANIAKVQNKEGENFLVGMDCAETLSGIKDSFEFNYTHKVNFNQAKQVRAKVLKFKKDSSENTVTVWKNKDGDSVISYNRYVNGNFNGRGWNTYKKDVYENYILPMIVKEISEEI
jgi:hypothetical protein